MPVIGRVNFRSATCLGGAAGKPVGNALLANRGRNVHAAGTLSIDRWNGEERVQLRLTDMAMIEPVAR